MLVQFESLTANQRDDFYNAFYKCVDIAGIPNDCSSEMPWGQPWFFEEGPVNLSGSNAREWGQAWFALNKEDMIREMADDIIEDQEEKLELAGLDPAAT